MHEYLGLAIDVLTAIVFNSIYPQKEIDKEVEVICDEFESYNDSPADFIYDEFEDLVFKGTPLGHNILGTPDRVRSFTTSDALRFTRKFYTPGNAVFFVACHEAIDVGFASIVNMIAEALTKAVVGATISESSQPSPLTTSKESKINIPTNHTSYSPPLEGPWEASGQATLHQAHVMFGATAYPYGDRRFTAMYLLNNILGGPGMNSRLNLSLRELCGLVYTVESTLVSYKACRGKALWSVYFGCDHSDIDECMSLVRKELDRLMDGPLSAAELLRAK